jgi:uncharacterized YkwD family protein
MSYNAYVATALVHLIDSMISTGAIELTDQSSRILKLANAERAKSGINGLIINRELNKLAAIKSQEMAEKGYFSHHSPTHGSPFDMMRAYGINYNYAGENLAIDKNADNAHTAWMNSKAHRENILNTNFTEIGIGIYAKTNSAFTYTQMFIG